MVPVSKIDACPSVDRYTHVCTICGLKDAHMWRCISWFIATAIDFYKKNLISQRALLQKLHDNQHVTAAEVKDAIDKLDYLEQLGKEVLKDETKRT